MAKLETQVGRPLLSRRKGKVMELTSEGDRLAQYARRILQLNDEACASMSDEALAGFVRLGVPLDFFGRDFTIWLARFKAKHLLKELKALAKGGHIKMTALTLVRDLDKSKAEAKTAESMGREGKPQLDFQQQITRHRSNLNASFTQTAGIR